MSRTDLKVPYGEKDEAKHLGARWDSAGKTWYVPAGTPLDAFAKWLPPVPDIDIRCDTYCIARTATRCWKCGDATSVMGIVLPSGHETLESDDDGSTWWERRPEPCFVYYITEFLAPVAARSAIISPHYRLAFSKTTASSYFMNHCEHCKMKQGDFGLYCEPGGAFFPMSPDDARDIRIQTVEQPFGCRGNGAYGDQLFDLARRAQVQASPPLSAGETASGSLKRWFISLLR